MTGGNFDPELRVRRGGIVEAKGPLQLGVKDVNEMCVWIIQRRGANADDAISNEMGPPGGAPRMSMGGKAKPHTLKLTPPTATQSGRWEFPLTDRLTNAPAAKRPSGFVAGPAEALAVGVFIDDQNHQRAFVWTEQVWLTGPGAPESGS